MTTAGIDHVKLPFVDSPDHDTLLVMTARWSRASRKSLMRESA